MSAIKLRSLKNGLLALLSAVSLLRGQLPSGKEKHLLYVASPGIRNYQEYGGVGVLVFDIDGAFRFVKRLPTWDVPPGQEPENVKGIAASAKTGRIYVTTINRMMALDAVTGKKLWDRAYDGGCDRLAVSPDGQTLYVPQLEGKLWRVVNTDAGAVITSINTQSGSHNTICSLDGTRVYLAGLRSPLLSVADTRSRTIVSSVGPFSDVIRPFTINGSNTLCFVNGRMTSENGPTVLTIVRLLVSATERSGDLKPAIKTCVPSSEQMVLCEPDSVAMFVMTAPVAASTMCQRSRSSCGT